MLVRADPFCREARSGHASQRCSAADTTVKQKAGSVLVPSRAAAMLTAGLQSLADPALDLFHGVDKVNAVGVVLRKNRGDGQHVAQDAVAALADADLVLECGRLALLVEGHDHHSCSVAHAELGLSEELLLAHLQGDGVHDALALNTLQAPLDHRPLEAQEHHARVLGQLRKLSHGALLHLVANGLDVRGEGAAAAPNKVQDAVLGVVETVGEDLRILVVAAHDVRQASVGVHVTPACTHVAELLVEALHLRRTHRTLDADGKGLGMLHLTQKPWMD